MRRSLHSPKHLVVLRQREQLANDGRENERRAELSVDRIGDAAYVAFQGQRLLCPERSEGASLAVLRITAGARPEAEAAPMVALLFMVRVPVPNAALT